MPVRKRIGIRPDRLRRRSSDRHVGSFVEIPVARRRRSCWPAAATSRGRRRRRAVPSVCRGRWTPCLVWTPPPESGWLHCAGRAASDTVIPRRANGMCMRVCARSTRLQYARIYRNNTRSHYHRCAPPSHSTHRPPTIAFNYFHKLRRRQTTAATSQPPPPPPTRHESHE